MFDDPKKHLQWMEEELLAEEADSETGIEEVDEDLELDWEEIMKEDWSPIDPPGHNSAVDFGSACFADEEFDEDSAVLVQPKGMAAKKIEQTKKKEEHRQAKKAKKKEKQNSKGIGGLVTLALLELLGILLIMGWWIIWLIS